MGLVQLLHQEEFSDRFAKIIANELNIDVVKLSPLDRVYIKKFN